MTTVVESRASARAFLEIDGFRCAANRICDVMMRVDELALSDGVSLRFGGSLVAVARRS